MPKNIVRRFQMMFYKSSGVSDWNNTQQIRTRIKKDFDEAKEEIDWYVKRAPKVEEALALTYEDKIRELRTNVLKTEQLLKKEQYTPEEFGTATDKVFNTLKNPMSMWKSEEYNDKKTIIYMYFEGNLRYDYERGFGTANLAYPLKLINEIGQAKKPDVEMSGYDPESE